MSNKHAHYVHNNFTRFLRGTIFSANTWAPSQQIKARSGTNTENLYNLRPRLCIILNSSEEKLGRFV